ncbi:thrombospondin type 3 repeat-containing protein [Corallococcus silvisoli]|uniref:thrombospondin type 3 repeat-containing protein n=1 Tax=Corallococcus silvisoli TaxID=2697031 RepID=UPI0013770483|nr:thrombospondin type 3 repeat-containing protein [Corallococcus silvisoli]NBD13788.1 amidohydrolase family protein [Corallococcus silvisoli]
MRSSPRLLLAALGAVLLLANACGSSEPEVPNKVVCGDGKKEGSEQCDDGNTINGDGCESNCTITPTTPGGKCGDGVKDANEACDDGNTVSGDGCEADCTVTPTQNTQCWSTPPAPLADGATCAVTKVGTAGKLFTGVVLKDGETLTGGQVLVNAQGVITCAACDCSQAAGAAEATAVLCPTGVISPGLINPHDHITYPGSPLASTSTERYEHRHEWRTGANSHTRLSNGSNTKADAIRWSELRQVMSGTTSIAGAGGQLGFLRNLDVSTVAQQEGLAGGYADSDTFPLGDSSGTLLTEGCSYSGFPSSVTLTSRVSAYLPHIAEGIATTALNEFRCLSTGSGNVLFPRSAIIHGVGLTAREISEMAAHGTGLIWSPRSNISLYGDTAMVTAFKRVGVNIALGTDWIRSGSMNLLRELRCADHLNATRYANTFTDEDLWRMVTSNAADAVDFYARVGRIAPNKVADLAIYRLGTHAASPFRAVIAAEPQDVVLTMRGGKPLYGDQALVDGLKGTDVCDALAVCGTQKAACVKSEIGKTLAEFQGSTDTQGLYPLFACGTPTNEPTCEPARNAVNTSFPAAAVNGSTVYSGVASAQDADADGIPDSVDNCPTIFNPVRPMDNGRQLDTDGDGVGDACDPCPLEAGTTSCVAFRGDDDDHDGVPTWRDNCPFVANADQKDTDGDGKGDVCDGCPTDANACSVADPTDFDYDGVLTPLDNCPLVANPDQKDTDGDGVGDACDACPAASPAGGVCNTTVYDVKATPSFGNTSLIGTKVAVDDVVVTAVDAKADRGYWVQVANYPAGKGAENSGLFIYSLKSAVAVGDNIRVEGTLKDYFGLLEVTDGTVTKHSGGNAPPAPVVVRTEAIRTGGPKAKALEGALVEVRDVFNTRLENSNREFIVDENKSGNPASSGLMVDDQAYSYPTQVLGTEYTALRGVLTFNFSAHKLVPRSAADMVVPLPPVPALTAFTSGGFVRVGGTQALPQPATVTMASAYPVDVTVNITSSAPTALVAANGQVVIPAGQTSAAVTLSALAQASAVELTATLGTSSQRTTLRVLGTNEAASPTGLTPQTVAVAPGGTARFTVTFDRPVPAGTTLAPVATPSGFGAFTLQPVVTDALTATFDLTVDEASTGSGTVTVAGLSATVNVATDVPRLVGLTPSTATVNAGAQQAYTVTLDAAPSAPVQVLLALAPDAASTPFGALSATTVTVAAGATTATVTFTAAADGEGTGTVSASLNGITRTASLTVLPPPAKLASVTPGTVTVTTGKEQVFTVTLDRKASVGGAAVSVAFAPAAQGSLSASTVTVPEGQTTATVTFTASQATGSGQLTATYAGVTKQATVTVALPQGHVVISEIAGQGLTVNADDFIELYNPTEGDVDITGWKLLYRTASTTSSTVNFSVLATLPNATIKAHGYYLVAGSSYSTTTVPADYTWGGTDISGSTGNVRLGTADVTLDPVVMTGVVDTVGYGTGRTVVEGAAAPAPPGKGGSVERKARASSTVASMLPGGADEFAGNGQDSDNNAADFLPRTERQPQNSQSPLEMP